MPPAQLVGVEVWVAHDLPYCAHLSEVFCSSGQSRPSRGPTVFSRTHCMKGTETVGVICSCPCTCFPVAPSRSRHAEPVIGRLYLMSRLPTAYMRASLVRRPLSFVLLPAGKTLKISSVEADLFRCCCCVAF